MDFTFTPDWEADLPLYEQIYRYAVAEIRAGRLAEGDKLPPPAGRTPGSEPHHGGAGLWPAHR